MKTNQLKLLCFGEILWDFLPVGLFPGGAPFNVAYHLHNHRAEVNLITAVGNDKLGDELIRRIKGWGLNTDTIGRHPGLPTGYVLADIAPNGDATYEFMPSVAWDQITTDQDSLQAAMDGTGIIFGSLAQRASFNQFALDRLLATMPENAWRIFDVNLRAPHDDLDRVRILASQSTLLKLNAAEAAHIACDQTEEAGREESDSRALAKQTGCTTICITSGERGAGLLRNDIWHWEDAQKVQVIDTIGAGDAFLASLIANLIPGHHTDAECLAVACRLGEWVASQYGATPTYPPPASS